LAELPFFPMAIDAYLADTRHLDDAEHGRYHLILYELWRSPRQRMPNDDEWLARRLCRSVDRIVTEIRPLIKEFCDCDGNWITQKRLSKEFLRARKVTKQRSDAAKSLWRKKKKASERIREDAQPRINSADEPTPTPTPTHTPTKSLEAEEATAASAFAAYQAAAKQHGWPEPQFMNSTRKWALLQRLRECDGLVGWQAALDAASAAEFLKGQRWFDFDWMLKPENFTRLMEGRYAERLDRSRNSGHSFTADFAEASAALRGKQYRGL
jgi:uncharacterized protein YdaU (DUF1376 family)